ncbi:MAG: hypothetical protein KAS04_06655 [Candidatus Aenigmarchaeota archaeon]|nr:hypothetical protein [Candidatus Aenigmarchaeota archaeon]
MSYIEIGHIERIRAEIEEQYESNPTECGGSFGELLCWELHTNEMTFIHLAKKWGISLDLLGELIWDHCKKLSPAPKVNHDYKKEQNEQLDFINII